MTVRCLVIENDPTDDPRRLGDWLTGAGLTLDLVRPYAGDALPNDLSGFGALLVLGGDQHAYPGPDGQPGAGWFPKLEGLLRKAVRTGVPTLGVCLGAQLLAVAHAGTVEASVAGPEIGPALVAKRDAAEHDPLFGPLPMLPDVIHWHYDDVTELPLGAVLLATSTDHPHQAFRIGECAWGLQFHIECDAAMIADWASSGAVEDPDALVAAVDAAMDDVFEAWQPFAYRFAAVAKSELAPASRPGRELPLLGH